MPRKTDGIPFQLQPRPTRNEDGKQLLYARLLPGRRMKLDMVDDMFTRGRSYRLGDFKRMMETFIELFGRYIAMGFRVETPLGSFAPKLRTHGEYTSPEQVSNGSVSYAGIEFTPSRAFSQEVERHQRGCLKANVVVGNEQMHDEKAMNKALEQGIDHGIITVKAFMVYSRLRYKSAKKYLDSLCEGDTPRLRSFKRSGKLFYEVIE